MTEVLSPAEEFDFTEAGIPTLRGVPATITNVEKQEVGKGVQLYVEFLADGLSFPVGKGYWIDHENPKAANAGRGTLKRIAQAAIGTPKFGITQLIGARLVVDVDEDDQGFARVRGFRALTEQPRIE